MGLRGGMKRVVARLSPLAFDADAQARREAVAVLSQHVEPGSVEFMHILVSPPHPDPPLHLILPPA
jgi:hypothetical protein